MFIHVFFLFSYPHFVPFHVLSAGLAHRQPSVMSYQSPTPGKYLQRWININAVHQCININKMSASKCISPCCMGHLVVLLFWKYLGWNTGSCFIVFYLIQLCEVQPAVASFSPELIFKILISHPIFASFIYHWFMFTVGGTLVWTWLSCIIEYALIFFNVFVWM